jgi:hypothetical protein
MLFEFQKVIAEGGTVEYFQWLKKMCHDAKSVSHLNGEVYS